MRRHRLPKDMTPSPRPWAWGMTPSGNHAVVKGANGELVCVCRPANAKEMCDIKEPIEDIYGYSREVVR